MVCDPFHLRACCASYLRPNSLARLLRPVPSFVFPLALPTFIFSSPFHSKHVFLGVDFAVFTSSSRSSRATGKCTTYTHTPYRQHGSYTVHPYFTWLKSRINTSPERCPTAKQSLSHCGLVEGSANLSGRRRTCLPVTRSSTQGGPYWSCRVGPRKLKRGLSGETSVSATGCEPGFPNSHPVVFEPEIQTLEPFTIRELRGCCSLNFTSPKASPVGMDQA